MSQLNYIFARIVQEFNNICFLDKDGCVDLCANDFMQPYNRLSRFAQIEGKTKSTVILNHIHRTNEWARDMRLQQIVDMGKYQDKIHNSKHWDISFGEPRVNDIIMIGSYVKSHYQKYGLVVKVFNKTSALVRAGRRIFKYSTYQLSPVLREKLSLAG